MALDWNGLRFNSVDTNKTAGLGAIGKDGIDKSNLGDIRTKAQENSPSGRFRSPTFNHYNDSLQSKDNLTNRPAFDKKQFLGRQDIGISNSTKAIRQAEKAAALKDNLKSKASGDNENKSYSGPLQYGKPITARQFVGDTIKEMDKTGAFDKFLPKAAQTKKNKINVALGIASKIEGKNITKGNINSSFIHRPNAVKFGDKVRAGKESFDNRRHYYSDLQTRKAVGGVIGDMTGRKPLSNWGKS